MIRFLSVNLTFLKFTALACIAMLCIAVIYVATAVLISHTDGLLSIRLRIPQWVGLGYS
jgi:hypothetical protein